MTTRIPTTLYTHITIACAGFLTATLWMDLIFDVQVIPHLDSGQVPEEVLASIQAYYLRVTTDAWPMGALVGIIILVGVVTNTIRLFKSREWLPGRFLSLLLMVLPSGWAVLSIFPDAQRLAVESLDFTVQSHLVIRIFWGHVTCLALILSLIVVQGLARR